MIKRVVRIIAILFLVAGISLLAYPPIKQQLHDAKAEKEINRFEDIIKDAKADLHNTDTDNTADAKKMYLNDLYEQMQAYNKDLYENGQSDFKDAWSYQPASFDMRKWGFEQNIVGYIEIPAMNVKLPIYLGATRENMALGAAHLTETSLPIGGENTNSVIAGHRGYSAIRMFRYIEILKKGDRVYITNPWETMTYEVAQTKVIIPTDTEKVLIQSGKDLITLFTCHPYPTSTYRYLVYCERVV